MKTSVSSILHRSLALTLAFLLLLVFFPALTPATYADSVIPAPCLAFGDLAGGPAGAVVTIWGRNFGAYAPNSKVMLTGQYGLAAAATLEVPILEYNEDAIIDNGSEIHWGIDPLNLLDRVSFVIPALDPGEYAITLSDEYGTESINALLFEVRAANDVIRYVVDGGDGITGAADDPFGSLREAMIDYASAIEAGMIIYIVGDIAETSDAPIAPAAGTLEGTAEAPIAFVGYPGSNATVANTGTGAAMNLYVDAGTANNLTFSRIGFETAGSIAVRAESWDAATMTALQGLKIIGCELKARLSGTAGIYQGGSDDLKLLGNKIGFIGGGNAAKNDMYILPRVQNGGVADIEIAYNRVGDFYGTTGGHIMHFNSASNPVTGASIHDNFFYRTRSGIRANDGALLGKLDLYNNIFYEVNYADATSGNSDDGRMLYFQQALCEINLVNNTFYDYGVPDAKTGTTSSNGAVWFTSANNGNVFISNNVFFSSSQSPRFLSNSSGVGTPVGYGNVLSNIWNNTIITWDNGGLLGNGIDPAAWFVAPQNTAAPSARSAAEIEAIDLTLLPGITISGTSVVTNGSGAYSFGLADIAANGVPRPFNPTPGAIQTAPYESNDHQAGADTLSMLTVNGIPVSGFDADETEYTVTVPFGTTGATVAAAATDPKAKVVSAGVGILEAGPSAKSFDITVTATDGTPKKYMVTVVVEGADANAVESISLSKQGAPVFLETLYVGESIALKATGVLASDGVTQKDVTADGTWSCNDIIASVAEGVVTAKGVGSTVVKIAKDGAEAEMLLHVRNRGDGGAPVVYYSDLTSGPNTGSEYGGAIVTVWGINFGDYDVAGIPAGTKVEVGGTEAARYYYWTDTEIAFTVASSTGAGPKNITVTTNEGTSAQDIPFTVRAGNLIFVSTEGDDNNNGSWSAPVRTVIKGRSLMENIVQAQSPADHIVPGGGDILYLMDGIEQTTLDPVFNLRSTTFMKAGHGTAELPFAVVAYPGAYVVIGNDDISYAVAEYFGGNPIPIAGGATSPSGLGRGWTFSKIVLRGRDFAMNVRSEDRVIACDIMTKSASSAAGALDCWGRDIVLYGNFIHDIGWNDATPTGGGTKLYHAVYFKSAYGEEWNDLENNPLGLSDWQKVEWGNNEMGWNVINNTWGDRAIHINDSSWGGGSNGSGKQGLVGSTNIHDNLIYNTKGGAIVYAEGVTGTHYFYNNILYNTGNGDTWSNGDGDYGAIDVKYTRPEANINVFDNTFVNGGNDTLGGSYNSRGQLVNVAGYSRSGGRNSFIGTVTLINNIFYQGAKPNTGIQHNIFGNELTGLESTPGVLTASGNMFYGPDAARLAGEGYGAVGDPRFVDPAAVNFRLQDSSPARGSGADTSAIAPANYTGRDYFGTVRGTVKDIGAYQSDAGVPMAEVPGPFIAFSDLISGPGGAIVTIWGRNFEPFDTGTSKVFLDGDEVSLDIPNLNASGGAISQSGAAVRWGVDSVNGLDCVSFVVPNKAEGAYDITLANAYGASNAIPFAIRAGNIKYAVSGGAGNGDMAAPFGGLAAAMAAALAPGDVVYLVGTMNEATASSITTALSDVAFVGYPGASATVSLTADDNNGVIRLLGESGNNGIVFSKIKFESASRVAFYIDTMTPYVFADNNRVIGCELIATLTAGTSEYGIISGGGNNTSLLGNKLGFKPLAPNTPVTPNRQHSYIINRVNGGTGDQWIYDGLEIGWNRIGDFYGQTGSSVFYAYWHRTSNVSIHDNFIYRTGGGIRAGAGGNGLQGKTDIYNNIFYEVNWLLPLTGTTETSVLDFGDVSGELNFVNNTFYEHGAAPNPGADFIIRLGANSVNTIANNIFFNATPKTYWISGGLAPAANNYGNVFTGNAPAWDTGATIASTTAADVFTTPANADPNLIDMTPKGAIIGKGAGIYSVLYADVAYNGIRRAANPDPGAIQAEAGTADPNADVTLASLIVKDQGGNQLTLAPELFDPETLEYSVNVAVTSVTIDAVASVPAETLVIGNGIHYLEPGDNVLKVIVAGNGTTKTYSVKVTRLGLPLAELAGLTVDKGTLTPAFDPEQITYTITVPWNVTDITIAATPDIGAATATRDGVTTDLNEPQALTARGSTVFVITVSDGNVAVVDNSYTLTVTRENPPLAKLDSLSVTPGNLNPAFNPNTNSYTVSVAESVTDITIAAFTDNLNAAVTAGDIGAKGLNFGANTFTVRVGPAPGYENNWDMNAYTIVVTRATGLSEASERPFIAFSDLTSGPEGAVVTVWGRNFGGYDEANSKIKLGAADGILDIPDLTVSSGAIAATGTKIHWGRDPVNGLDRASFVVPSLTIGATYNITVANAKGVSINAIPFTARAGNILYAAAGGNASNAGSQGAPFGALADAMAAIGSKIMPGDIVYFVGNMSETSAAALQTPRNADASGISFIGYPGADVTIEMTTATVVEGDGSSPNVEVPGAGGSMGVLLLNADADTSNDGLLFSRLKFVSSSDVAIRVDSFDESGIVLKDLRIIGCDLLATAEADTGGTGAFYGGSDDLKFLGNQVRFKAGAAITNNQRMNYFLFLRYSGGAGMSMSNLEVAYNRIGNFSGSYSGNNAARGGNFLYIGSFPVIGLSFHDNFVHQTNGGVRSEGVRETFDFYNNVISEVNEFNPTGFQGQGVDGRDRCIFVENSYDAHVNIINNTFYRYGIAQGEGLFGTRTPQSTTFTIANNIFYHASTRAGKPVVNASYAFTPETAYYGNVYAGTVAAVPAWDLGATRADVNADWFVDAQDAQGTRSVDLIDLTPKGEILRKGSGAYSYGFADIAANGMPRAADPDPGAMQFTKDVSDAIIDNNLTSLAVVGETLTPFFDPAISSYTLTDELEYTATEVTIEATVDASQKASIKGAGARELNTGPLELFTVLEVVVTANDGSAKTYTITVKRAAPTADTLVDLELNGRYYSVYKGEPRDTEVTAMKYGNGPGNFAMETVTESAAYACNNPSVVSINSAGVVTGLKVGAAEIEVSYGGITKTVYVHVRERGAGGTPVVYYSDLTSGPAVGGDEAGIGAIITIWGVNFGDTRGSSAVKLNGQEVVKYYYWTDTEICFAIGMGATSGNIEVTTAVGTSAQDVPFTVRDGRLIFVSVDGDDASGDGSFANPYRTVLKGKSEMVNTYGPPVITGMPITQGGGDILYLLDGVEQTTLDAGFAGNVGSMFLNGQGTAELPFAIVAYPGACVVIGSPSASYAFTSVGGGNGDVLSRFWTLSKLVVRSNDVAIQARSGFRIVGNDVKTERAPGQTAAIEAWGRDITIYGNYLHDIAKESGDAANGGYHALYMKGAYVDEYLGMGLDLVWAENSYSTANISLPEPEFMWNAVWGNNDVGWNVFHDTYGTYAIQINAEHNFGGPGIYDGSRIHDNLFYTTRAATITYSANVTGDHYYYNNITNNTGAMSGSGNKAAVHIGANLESKFYVFNNTFVNCGPGSGSGALLMFWRNAYSDAHREAYVYNNIFYQTSQQSNGTPHGLVNGVQNITAASNNLFFGGAPGEATDLAAMNFGIEGDPLFEEEGSLNFRLLDGSPAIGAGIDVADIAPAGYLGLDYYGAPRVATSIGAIESMTTVYNTDAFVTGIIELPDAIISDISDNAGTITATVAIELDSVDLTATVSDGATATYWLDPDCLFEFNGILALSDEDNFAYIKVVAEDGLTTNIYTVVITRVWLVSATPSAYVEKLGGNQNRLFITVIEYYSDGTEKYVTWDGLINNNAAGAYQVGGYTVYVDTKGNDQIRECYIV